MTQSPIEPPNNPSPSASRSSDRSAGASRTGASRSLTFDEGVALLVAFLSLGSVLFWGLTRGGMNLMNEAIADAESPALIVNGDGQEPIAFDFGNGESEIATSDSDTETGNVEAGNDRASGDVAGNVAGRPRGRRILDDARTGVAGAAAGIAGTAATSESAEAETANIEDTEAEGTGVAGSGGADTEASTTADNAATNDASEASTPEAASLSAAATADPKDAIAFEDVPDNYWAKPYIDALSSRELISGFDDGNFRPDQPVTRAQIANIVSRTFDLTADKENLAFSDVESNFWARESIEEVVKGGFMTGFPNETFAPNDPVTRAQAFTTLVTGLGVAPPTNVQASIDRYTDANSIPNWATEKVAAATAGGLVVNYPNQQSLNPNQPTTRAELSAMIYQALAKEGIVDPIESEYVVKP